jgi:hypothetical protein
MKIEQRIEAFTKLGEQIRDVINGKEIAPLSPAIKAASIANGWFAENFIINALSAISDYLERDELTKWTSNYKAPSASKTIGVIMPGNIPAAGFFDAMCVLISGHSLIAKLSSDDTHLMKALFDMLTRIEPAFSERIMFGDFRQVRPDAVIATGSNNTARYFDYYFAKFPNIIRKNRNSVAVLTGDETEAQLSGLADDVFTYFGLGCRNVSKVFVPEGYDLDNMFRAFFRYKWVVDNKKYGNNYDYHKTLYLLDKKDIIENGFLLLKEDIGLSSPMATLFYEKYKDLDAVKERLRHDGANIQCVVSSIKEIPNVVPFGKAQKPGLMDYADKVDVMKFLSEL